MLSTYYITVAYSGRCAVIFSLRLDRDRDRLLPGACPLRHLQPPRPAKATYCLNLRPFLGLAILYPAGEASSKIVALSPPRVTSITILENEAASLEVYAVHPWCDILMLMSIWNMYRCMGASTPVKLSTGETASNCLSAMTTLAETWVVDLEPVRQTTRVFFIGICCSPVPSPRRGVPPSPVDLFCFDFDPQSTWQPSGSCLWWLRPGSNISARLGPRDLPTN